MSHQGLVSARTIAPLAAVLFALLLLAPVSVSAAEQVGRVLVAVGGVTATQDDASARGLGRGDPVYTGDIIRTGARGRVQMRFQDGAMVDLEPGSRFEVNEYSGGDGGGSVVMSFLRGAMRTITGAIGIDSGEEYRMNTTVATIGVRGTAYALHYCDADCVDAGGDPGLYGRVDEGEISVDGPFGSFAFSSGQYFFIPENGEPRRIVVPPEGILGGGDEDGAGGDDEQIEDVEIRPLGTRAEDGDLIDEGDGDLLDPGFEAAELFGNEAITGIAAYSAAFAGQSDSATDFADGQLFATGGAFTLDSNNRVTSAEFDRSGSLVGISNANVSLAESGVFTSLGVGWGRWNGAFADDSGVDYNGNMAFMVTNNLTAAENLTNMNGTLSYELAGGPSAFDQGGQLWSVDAAEISVDFDAVSVGLVQLNLSENVMNGASFAFSGADVQTQNLDPSGNSFTLEFGPSFNPDRNTLSGQFVGRNAEGAIVVFDVRDSDGVNQVSGTAVLQAQ